MNYTEETCDECGKKFEVQVHTSVAWCCEPIDEIEFVKVEINAIDSDAKTAKAENYVLAPDWLWTILSNDDDIYQEICSQDHSHYPEYEYGDD